MIETRTYVSNLLKMVEQMKKRTLKFKADLQSLSNQTDYDNTVKHYEHLIKKLKEKLKTLPIGYRYEGTYFIKKAYTMPPQFEECHGFLYVPENLVSWQIEEKPGVIKNYTYYRSIYKEPFGELLTKKHAQPVYEAD